MIYVGQNIDAEFMGHMILLRNKTSGESLMIDTGSIGILSAEIAKRRRVELGPAPALSHPNS